LKLEKLFDEIIYATTNFLECRIASELSQAKLNLPKSIYKMAEPKFFSKIIS